MVDGRADRAIVVGGGGQGEVIACNKISGIQAGLCPDVWHAQISRQQRRERARARREGDRRRALPEQVLDTWLTTPFKGAEHARRIAMIAALERGETLL